MDSSHLLISELERVDDGLDHGLLRVVSVIEALRAEADEDARRAIRFDADHLTCYESGGLEGFR